MADGLGVEAHANSHTSAPANPQDEGGSQARKDAAFRRALLFVGIGAASAGLAFAVVRATLARPPADPTTERIQQLIDEANRLLKTLDDKKPE